LWNDAANEIVNAEVFQNLHGKRHPHVKIAVVFRVSKDSLEITITVPENFVDGSVIHVTRD
jgi:hypothetical protein